MDVVIKPFWLAISFAYFVLAWLHYKIQSNITIISSNFIESMERGNFDQPNIAFALRRIKDNETHHKRLIRYASYGFLLAGIISLAQGLLNLEYGVTVDVIFILLALFVVLLIIYLKGKWLVDLFVGFIRVIWFKIQYDKDFKKRF
ncbi:MAG: hypothetical protein ACXV5H_06535 [Halobacteriota archaeon]